MHKAVKLLRKIPREKVTTYKELAQAAKTHPRAIGAIMHSNKDTVKYPCYKVVMSDGRIGGYGGGVRKKIELLKKDGVAVKNGFVDLGRHMFRPPKGPSKKRRKK